MTSLRILNLMALMAEIEKPHRTYILAVRKATRTTTDSDENDAAQARGNSALLEIEQTIRQWVAEHPATTSNPQTRNATMTTDHTTAAILVEALGLAGPDFQDLKDRIEEAAAAHKATVTIDGRKHPADLPSSFRRTARIAVTCALGDRDYDEADRPHHFATVEDAIEEVTSMGWHELADGRVLCHEQDEDHADLGSRVGVVDQDGPHQPGCDCWGCTYE